MRYNFDNITDRRNTHSTKLDALPAGVPKDALPLWVADMDFPCAQPILEAVKKRVDHSILGYTVNDNDEYKSAVISWFDRRYAWKINKGDIFYSPGVVPALAFMVEMLTVAGDGVVVQRPVYHPFSIKVTAAGRIPVNNALLYEDGAYHMDYEDLEQKMSDPKNKGMIFCNPHNPVGRVWTEEEIQKMVDICRRYDKWIISDEIHCDLTRVGITNHPILKLVPEYKDRIIVCTAPSKTFNLAGMHLASIIIPNPEYQARWKRLTDERYGVTGINPLSMTAMVAAYEYGEEWLEQLREYLDENIRFVKGFVKEYLPKAIVVEPEGTYLLWIDFNGYCSDIKILETLMMQTAKVALDEGYIFGTEGSGFERINAACPRSVLEDCMKRIKAAVDTLS